MQKKFINYMVGPKIDMEPTMTMYHKVICQWCCKTAVHVYLAKINLVTKFVQQFLV